MADLSASVRSLLLPLEVLELPDISVPNWRIFGGNGGGGGACGGVEEKRVVGTRAAF